MSEMPMLRRKNNGWELVVAGKPFIIFGGQVHNSSASSLQYMEEHVWDAVTKLNCNTLFVPIYWELIEPQEGIFDFSIPEGLLEEAGKRRLKLVFLWFGTWKNTLSIYVPEWVRKDTGRFFRMENMDGRKTSRISCFCDEAVKSDSRAFAALMKRLREIDGEMNTVIMVQIQNEVGILESDRDYSPASEKYFRSNVPDALIGELIKRKEQLRKEIICAWNAAGMKEAGTWNEIFGELAEEIFSAWHTARYVETVASAGKAEYALPMFVNAWLVQSEGQPVGCYPSGGPVSKVIDIWKIAAPSICLSAPDIYLENFSEICADYSNEDNPLLIPEARRDETAASNVFYAVGRHHVLGFSPFGIESMVTNSKVSCFGNSVADASANMQNSDNGRILAQSYSLLQNMILLISDCYGTDKMTGVLQSPGIEKQYIRLGAYELEIKFNLPLKKGKPPGAGLFIMLDNGEYFIAGHGFKVSAISKIAKKNDIIETELLEEGHFINGEWRAGRRLRGDEGGVFLYEIPSVLHLKLFSFECKP